MQRSSDCPGIRWIARLITFFLIGNVLLIFIGEAGFNPLKLSLKETVMMVFFFATCIGMVIAWRWEVVGGIIATAGILLFFGTQFAVTGGFPKGWMFRLMLLPGILFVLTGFLQKRLP